jgi:hypothetical protein
MEDGFAGHAVFTRLQRQLVDARFLHEYSFEAAALFNPSIVSHPDQSGAGRRAAFSPQSSRRRGRGSVRFEDIRLERCCSTRRIPPRFSPARARRGSDPSHPSAKATSPMSSTRAEPCGTMTRSFCHMRFPTPFQFRNDQDRRADEGHGKLLSARVDYNVQLLDHPSEPRDRAARRPDSEAVK